MNQIKCGECKKYHAMERPKRNKSGGMIPLKKGYCLDRSVFATNRPGNEVIPPGAKTAELEFGRHKPVIVREEQIVPNCTAARSK